MTGVILNVFDFDDTLVHQGPARVRVHTTHPGGVVTTKRVPWAHILSEKRPLGENQVLDHVELQEGPLVTIEWSCRLLQHLAAKEESSHYLVILTARRDPAPVDRLVTRLGVEDKVRVVGLGAGPEPGLDKARWILEEVISEFDSGAGPYTSVRVYEDRVETLRILGETLTKPLKDLYGCDLSLTRIGKEHRRAHGLRRLDPPQVPEG